MNTNTNAAEPMQIVAYYRVSTKRQNLGIDAQRRAVEIFAADRGAQIIAEYDEKESGKECDRPGLSRAMATARKYKAFLVVAKADRLSRNIAFAAKVVFNSSLKVIALNMPDEAMNDPLLFGVYYGLADQERRMISQRTKAALAEKKAQGVKLGRPDAATCLTDEIRAKAAESKARKADENENNVKASNEIRRYLLTGEKRTLQAIADHLNNGGFFTSRGVFHTPKSVSLLCRRYNIALK